MIMNKRVLKLYIKDLFSGWGPYEAMRNRARARAVESCGTDVGALGAPHPVKVHAVIDHERRFKTRVFVETGTLFGDMIAAVRTYFDDVHSIELDAELCTKAQRRFARHRNVHIHLGDSSKVLPDLLREIHQPALFWLDGHYSGEFTARGELETPISAELESILGHPIRNHVILVDDAREFNGTHDYPTLADLEAAVRSSRPDMSFTVKHDIIRIVPGHE
jgi:hypothetical protein